LQPNPGIPARAYGRVRCRRPRQNEPRRRGNQPRRRGQRARYRSSFLLMGLLQRSRSCHSHLHLRRPCRWRDRCRGPCALAWCLGEL